MSDIKFERENDDGQLVDLKQAEASVTAAIEQVGEDVASTTYTSSETPGQSRFVSGRGSRDEEVIVGSLNTKVSQGMSVFLTAMAHTSDSFPDQLGARPRSKFTDLVEPGYWEMSKRARKGETEGPRSKAELRGGKDEDVLGSCKISKSSLTEYGPKGVKMDAKTVIRLGLVPSEYSNALTNIRESMATPSSLRLQDSLAKGNDDAERYVRANPTNLNVQAALH